MPHRARRCRGSVSSGRGHGAVLVCQRAPSAALQLLGIVTLRGVEVHRHKAEAGGEFLGALQRSLALFETGTLKPETIFKGRIALDSLPTVGTFFPLECMVELHHASSKTPGTRRGTLTRYHGCTLSYSSAILYIFLSSINSFPSWYQNAYIDDKHGISLL